MWEGLPSPDMIIRIPEEGSKELIKGEFIISRLGSLSHRVVALQNKKIYILW
jgi:hypothetical protein